MKTYIYFLISLILFSGVAIESQAAARTQAPINSELMAQDQQSSPQKKLEKKLKRLKKKATKGRIFRAFLLFLGGCFLFLLALLFVGFLSTIFFIGSAVAFILSVVYFIQGLAGV